MRIIIQKNKEEVGKWVAHHVASHIRDFGPTKSKPYVLGLPTGSSPIETYNELANLCDHKKVCFQNVITFNMDEYVGIPQSHPESYHSFMHKHLFSRIDIPRENINILNGNAKDLDQECLQYEERIKKAGPIRIFLGGVGSDGHIAFNEPGSSLMSRTRLKSLAMETIIDNSRFFDNDMDKVPKHALTVGVGTILDAEQVVIIVTGYKKAHVLQKVVEEGVNHMLTLSMLQLHQHSIIVCDEEATAELKVKTVKYFLESEHEALHPAKL
jgi:glucosamine-6-phosphate deaminase